MTSVSNYDNAEKWKKLLNDHIHIHIVHVNVLKVI